MRTHGCAIIYFDPDTNLDVPEPMAVSGITPPRGLTVGGAREWTVRGNPEVDLEDYRMEAFIVDPSGRRWGPVPH